MLTDVSTCCMHEWDLFIHNYSHFFPCAACLTAFLLLFYNALLDFLVKFFACSYSDLLLPCSSLLIVPWLGKTQQFLYFHPADSSFPLRVHHIIYRHRTSWQVVWDSVYFKCVTVWPKFYFFMFVTFEIFSDIQTFVSAHWPT